MNNFQFYSRLTLFLKSVGVADFKKLEEISMLITGTPVQSDLSDEEVDTLKKLIIVKQNVPARSEARYTTAQLGCNLSLKKADVELLLMSAGLLDYDLKLTKSGEEYGVIENGKLTWLHSVTKVLRKFK
jgi:hypothetical protein